MKRRTYWLMLAAMVSPGAVLSGCSVVLGSVRDAAIVGLTEFVTDTTFNLLDGAISTTTTEQ
jgi:hypothetical protein